MIQTAAAGAHCMAFTVHFGLQPVEICHENLSAGENLRKQFHLSVHAVMLVPTEQHVHMHTVTHTFVFFHKYE